MPATSARIALITQASRFDTQEDANIKAKFPLAREGEVEGYFSAEADATAINIQAFDLLSVPRGLWQVDVDDLIEIDFSQQVPTFKLYSDRLGMQAGRDLIVVSYSPRRSNRSTSFLLWG